MSESVKSLVERLHGEAAAAAYAFRELRDSNPSGFLDQAIDALRTASYPADSPAIGTLVRLAMVDPKLLDRIANPVGMATADAIRIARLLQAVEPATDAHLLQLLLPTAGSAAHDSWRATHVMEVVGAISDGRRIQPLLSGLMRHPDARVRSKAALLIGRLNPQLRWLDRRSVERDPRVRANAVEALWGSDSRQVREMFLDAAHDPHHRVAANGIVGLHRAGDLASVGIARELAVHADSRFRAAAVWAMGETRDPRFLYELATATDASSGSVRRNALRARVRIRQRLSELERGQAVPFWIGRKAMTLKVHTGTSRPGLSELQPTAFVLMDGSRSLDIPCVFRRRDHTATSFYYIPLLQEPPAGARLCIYADDGTGERNLPEASSVD